MIFFKILFKTLVALKKQHRENIPDWRRSQCELRTYLIPVRGGKCVGRHWWGKLNENMDDRLDKSILSVLNY